MASRVRVSPETTRVAADTILTQLKLNYTSGGLTEVPIDTLAASVGYDIHRSDGFHAGLALLKEDNVVEKIARNIRFTEKGIRESNRAGGPAPGQWDDAPMDESVPSKDAHSLPPGVPSFRTGQTKTTRQLLEHNFTPHTVHRLSSLAFGTDNPPQVASPTGNHHKPPYSSIPFHQPPRPRDSRGHQQSLPHSRWSPPRPQDPRSPPPRPDLRISPPKAPPPHDPQSPPDAAMDVNPKDGPSSDQGLDEFEKAEMTKVIAKQISGSPLHQQLLQKLREKGLNGMTPARISWAVPDLSTEVDRYCKEYQIPPCISSLEVLKELDQVVFQYDVNDSLRFYLAEEDAPSIEPNKESLYYTGGAKTGTKYEAAPRVPPQSTGETIDDMDTSLDESTAPPPAIVDLSDSKKRAATGCEAKHSSAEDSCSDNETNQDVAKSPSRNEEGDNEHKKLVKRLWNIQKKYDGRASLEFLLLMVRLGNRMNLRPKSRVEMRDYLMNLWGQKDLPPALQMWLEEQLEGYPPSHQPQRANVMAGRLMRCFRRTRCLVKSQGEEVAWDMDQVNIVVDLFLNPHGQPGKRQPAIKCEEAGESAGTATDETVGAAVDVAAAQEGDDKTQMETFLRNTWKKGNGHACMEFLLVLLQQKNGQNRWPATRVELRDLVLDLWGGGNLPSALQMWLEAQLEGYPPSHQRARANFVAGRLMTYFQRGRCLLKSGNDLEWDVERVKDATDLFVNQEGQQHRRNEEQSVAVKVENEEEDDDDVEIIEQEQQPLNIKEKVEGEGTNGGRRIDQNLQTSATSAAANRLTAIDNSQKRDQQAADPSLQAIENTPDGAAALAFLVMLSDNYKGRTWPSTRDEFRMCTQGLIAAIKNHPQKQPDNLPSSLCKYIARLCQDFPIRTVVARAVEDYLYHFQHAKCLTMSTHKKDPKKTRLEWNQERIDAVKDHLLKYPIEERMPGTRSKAMDDTKHKESKATKTQNRTAPEAGKGAVGCDVVEIDDSGDDLTVPSAKGKTVEKELLTEACSPLRRSPKHKPQPKPVSWNQRINAVSLIDTSLAANAALDIVAMLKASHIKGKRNWPNKTKSLCNFLRGFTNSKKRRSTLPQHFVHFVQFRRQCASTVKGKPIEHILVKVWPELRRLRCFKDAKTLFWDYDRVDELLALRVQRQIPNPTTIGASKVEQNASMPPNRAPEGQRKRMAAGARTGSVALAKNSTPKVPATKGSTIQLPSQRQNEARLPKRLIDSFATQSPPKRLKTSDQRSKAVSSAAPNESPIRVIGDSPSAVQVPGSGAVAIKQEPPKNASPNMAEAASTSVSTMKRRGVPQLGFDVSKGYAIVSVEQCQAKRPCGILVPSPPVVSNDVQVLLDLLPRDLAIHLAAASVQKELSEIVLDKGRQLVAWAGGNRMNVSSQSRPISSDDIADVVAKLGGFGSDNRAGLDEQLHRISAVRNRQQDIVGLTMQVGRHVSGSALMISDLFFADPTMSILFLGEPGSGKTTLLREVACLLSEKSKVAVVDTSSEIGGDGDVPHPSLGLARRIMVPSLRDQANVISQCAENQTPDVMVIDKIGFPEEVEAVRNCKDQGIRLVASTQGSLRKLLQNPRLRGLIGGIDPGVSAPSVFDMIVELQSPNEWRVIANIAGAVDCILKGEKYTVQCRTRDPSGSFQLTFQDA